MQIELRKTPALLSDLLFTLLFGLLSSILSKVEFQIPGIVNSDLREIPFLICLFYLRNPLFVFLLPLFAFYGAPADMPNWAVYQAHLIPLFAAFYSLKALERLNLSSAMMGIVWVAITVGYYFFALLPLVVIAASYTPSLTVGGKREFWEAYLSGLPSFRFEIITTALVTGLYLMQKRTRKKLEERNEKIKAQLELLRRYAYMNSHELRAPVARILGLLQLFEHEQVPEPTKVLLQYLQESSVELDNVIRQMNRVLEKEITIDE